MQAFCRLLDSLPHDQTFTQLVISQLRKFYDKCYTFFKTVVAISQPSQRVEQRPKKSAALAEFNADMRDLVTNLLNAAGQERANLLRQVSKYINSMLTLLMLYQETSLIVSSTKSNHLTDADLILDRKALSNLCTLYTSTRWFTTNVSGLRQLSTTMMPQTNSRPQNRRWTTLTTVNPNQAVYLPLDSDCARDFDAVTTSFADLASLVLRTLHLEIRLQIVAGITKTLSGSYALGQDYRDPDPAIINLCKGLLAMDEDLSTHLPETQYLHLTRSLSELADVALIQFASQVPDMDTHGNARMQLNILVLQQNLKDIEKEASLTSAAQYWELFDEGPDRVAAAVKARHVGKEEAKNMIRLWGSSRGDQGQRESEEGMRRIEAL